MYLGRAIYVVDEDAGTVIEQDVVSDFVEQHI